MRMSRSNPLLLGGIAVGGEAEVVAAAVEQSLGEGVVFGHGKSAWRPCVKTA
jgi:hypothetical protein